MKYYFLALLVWIVMIIMFLTIILIPVVMHLRDNNEWFASPFSKACDEDGYDYR